MGAYTDQMEGAGYEIWPEDENYVEELREVAASFRSFGEAVDSFLTEHGFDGDVRDQEEKIAFLKERMRAAQVPVPRNIRKWFDSQTTINRKPAFQVCFAFGLDAAETGDFLRRICLQRSFDCHDREELIYYYALGQGMTWPETEALLARLSEKPSDGKIRTGAVFTGKILEDVQRLQSPQELLDYIQENAANFGYNNVTASGNIRRIWGEISGENGLAAEESHRFYVYTDVFDGDSAEENEKHRNSHEKKEASLIKNTYSPEKKKENFQAEEKSNFQTEQKPVSRENSLWKIYLQIFGISRNQAKETKADRSLKEILKNNALLHPLAEDSFPDRDGLTKILNGVHVSDERVRKLLILLVFYRFWVKKALRQGNYEAINNDGQRCIAGINQYLIESGYPTLYYGNPYDWLFLFASMNDMPLTVFRDFMTEVFYEKQTGFENF